MRISFTKKALMDLEATADGVTVTDSDYAKFRMGTLRATVSQAGVAVAVQYRAGGKQSKKTLIAAGSLGMFFSSGGPGGSAGTIKRLHELAYSHVRDAKAKDMSVRQQQEAVALQREEEQRERLKEQAARRGIKDVGEAFLAHREVNNPLSESAVRSAKLALDRAVAVWGDTPVADLRREHGTELLNQVIEDAKACNKKRGARGGKNPGHEAAKSTRVYISQMLDFASDEIDVRSDIFKNRPLKSNPPKRGVLTADERMALFEALIEYETPKPGRTGRRTNVARDTADMIRLTYLCAARPYEWGKAQFKDVDLDTGTWLREEHKRKQGTDHCQVLQTPAIAILERIKERRTVRGRPPQGGDYIFPSTDPTRGKPYRTSFWEAFQTILDLAGIDNSAKPAGEEITPHVLRASRITEWHDEHGWDFDKIAKVMGNSVDVVRKVYYRPRTDLDELRGMVDVESDADLPI